MLSGKIIAFSGAHGTGKTSHVYKTAARLNIALGGSLGVITEVARDCPFPVYTRASTPTESAQSWIFCEQIRRDLEISSKYNVVVSDRSVVDTIAYSKLFGFTKLARAQQKYAEAHIGIYSVIRVCPINPKFLVDDGFRAEDPRIQVEYDKILMATYEDMGVVTEVAG